jgi:carboxyl-terminal processing protease
VSRTDREVFQVRSRWKPASLLAGALLAQSLALAAPPPATTPAAATAGAAPPPARPTAISVVDEIDRIVRGHYYAPDRLGPLHWDGAVAHAREVVSASGDSTTRTAAFRELLSTLATSHSEYYPREDPGYWALAGIFEPALARLCSRELRPALPLTVVDIGVFWKQVGPAWLVGGVYAGGPADRAGFRVGDEVVQVGDTPFSPVAAFAGKAGVRLGIDVRRDQERSLLHLTVVPESVRPHEALRKATEDSWRILSRGGHRIAYLHVWSWTSAAIQEVVEQAIAKSNKAAVDAFVLDLRDGWGGASPRYLALFDRDIPIMQSTGRDGSTAVVDDAQIRKPAVILINDGTRSGKEIIAYGAKKHHLARLVGERTAGAVMRGQPFCLRDGALLYLAVEDVRIDGERLEGAGVTPDIEVPFDIRHSGGEDPQLEKALELLSQ